MKTTASEGLVRFSKAVLEAAKKADSKYRFGRFKVFVSCLEPSKVTKAMLLEAHRAGLLSLARADLTPAMDLDEVKASEVSWMMDGRQVACFHFINLEAA